MRTSKLILLICLGLMSLNFYSCAKTQTTYGTGLATTVDDNNIISVLSTANSQCIITQDIDLKGKKIKTASNCCLYFLGGSLRNGEIEGNNTKLLATNNHIFKNIITTGKWYINECFPEWWGAVGNGKTDDHAAIQAAIEFCKLSGGYVRLGSAKYLISQPLFWDVPDGSPSPSLNIVGNGIHSSTIVFSGSCAIHIKRGVNPHLGDFSVMSQNNGKGAGIVLGTLEEQTTYVVRGFFENIYIYNCDLGVFSYGWMNHWTNLNARFNNLGVKDICTVSSYINPIIEGNKIGMKISGKKVIEGGTIEGNTEGGLEILGGKHTLTSVYFEANCPNDKSNDLNIYGIQNKGYHIKAGYDSPCEMILNTCNFSNGGYAHGRNTIELDKVHKFINNCCDDFTLLYTQNTGDYVDNSSFPEWQNGFSSNHNVEFYGRIKKPFDNVVVATTSCFGEKTDVSRIKGQSSQSQASSTIYLNEDLSVYCRVGNSSSILHNEDGTISIVSIDKNMYAHTLTVCVAWDKIRNRCGKLSCEADLQIIANKVITAKAYPSCGFSGKKDNGSNYSFVQSSAINSVDYYSFNPIRTYKITIDLDEIKKKINNENINISQGEIYFTYQFRYSDATPSPDKNIEAEKLQMKVSKITVL